YPVRATAFPTHLTAAAGGVPTFHLLPGLPLAPAFGFAGDREAAGELSLVLELPKGVTLRQACYLHPGMRQALPLKDEAASTGEPPCQRFRLPVPARVIGRTEPVWASVLATFLEPQPGFTRGELVYWLEGRAGNSARSTVQLVALPALPAAPRPRAFELFPWYQMTLSCPDPAVRAAQVAALEQLGARTTSYHGLDKQVARELKARGWKLVLGMGWSDRGPYGFQLHNYGRIDWSQRGYPEEVWIVDHRGQRHVGVFCPSYAAARGPLFVKEYRGWLGELIDAEARELCAVLSNDFEPGETGLMGARHSCFCERCRLEFAARIKAEPATIPDAAAILGGHLAAWTDYRMDLYARLIGFHTDVARELAPGMVNSICSHWVPDPPGAEIWPGEAIDVRRFDPYADQHTPMMYHGGTRLLDNLERTRQHLTKPLLVLTAAFYDAWSSSTVVFSPAEVRWNLVGIGSHGAAGAGFYASLDHCDGAYLHAIQAALADLARLEDDLAGTPVAAAVTGLGSNARAYRRRRAGRELVALFNADGRQAATAQLSVPDGWRAIDAL
ncbi:MAG: hypothetical protein HUU35_19715, partial [Armatimonadetes bacterium]|nr:hypothetical protein [Armatimonadota bacterium]